MSAEIVALAVANLLMWAVGIGLLPLLGLARTGRDVLVRAPLAYAVGLAATGIAASELALIDIPVGRIGLPLLAALVLVVGLRRITWRGELAARPRLSPAALPSLGLLVVVLVFIGNAARLFAVKPLLENDGWALWGMRAKALFDFGHPVAPVFTQGQYPALQYPLLLPELEAIGARFIGTFDGAVLHLQLLGIALAFVGAAWTLLRGRVSPLLLAAILLAVVTAPVFFAQLQTNSADVPLALFVALGVAALAAWLLGAEPLLVPAALFLTAGAMIKNEGELFVASAYLVAFLLCPRGRRRPLAIAAGATVVLIAPWHLWLLLHGVTATTFSLSHLLHPGYLIGHRHRVGTAFQQLLGQIRLESSWSLLPLVVLSAAVVAAVLRGYRVLAFAAGWLGLAFVGLLCVYWASPYPLAHDLYNSADRTVDTLVITGALLVPVLLQGSGGRVGDGDALQTE